MEAAPQHLRRFRDDQALVSLRRDGCDDHKIQGFVVHFSDALVLLQYVCDFRLDGLLLLRIDDITSIRTTATDEFQKRLLIEEGEFEKVDFDHRPPIHFYDAYVRSLPQNEIVIIEDELADDPEFLIGTLNSVVGDAVFVRYFTGAANWKDELSVIEIERITSCQIGTNYTQFYARHFSRIGEL